MRRLVTSYSTLGWTDDGSLVTKTRPAAPDARARFRNELRVNRLLVDRPPPVPTPRLVAHDVQRRSLTFEAFPGEPLGPKYPHGLAPEQIDAMAGLVLQMQGHRPRRRWFRRLDPVRRLRLAHAAGLLTAVQASSLLPLATRMRGTLRFAHGDVTARNVLVSDDGSLALIDWEWAGLHPAGYDLAFLWYSLVDVPGGRPRVEHHVATGATVDEPIFLLNALLIQLWHLHWYLPHDFQDKHRASRDHLLTRLLP